MRIDRPDLSIDLNAAGSAAFFVVRVDLDSGPVWLADRPCTLGGRTAIPALVEVNSVGPSGATVTVAPDGLSDWQRTTDFWIERRAVVLEVVRDLSDASVVLDGQVVYQPSESDDTWTIHIAPRTLRPAVVPSGDPINTTDWPSAPVSSQGQYPAEVYGTVDDCPLLPVALPRHSALSASVEPNATALPVDDATVFPASGTVVVDGVSYTYTSRDDATLMGVQVVRPHRAGTAVSQPGAAVFLAAGHAVEAIGPRRSEGRVVAGGAVDLSAATVTYPALPTVEDLGDLHTYTAEFDAVASGSTATDGANAIRAATGQVTQSGSTGTISSDGQFLFVPFPRPSAIGGTDTIILGGYTVAFSVSYSGSNRLSVSLGGAVVYVEDGGVVVYDASPASFFYHENTDQLPVQFGGLGDGEVASITITSASRTVTLGNDDTAAYATLDQAHNVLSVRQTTDMPDRGRVERARLAVEFWLSDALQAGESVGVSWRGNSLGTLRQTTDGRTTEDATVSFDLSQIGSAQLQSNNIAVSASGGTTQLNNVPTIVRGQVGMTYGYATTIPGLTIYNGIGKAAPPPLAQSGQTVTGKLYFGDTGTNTPNVWVQTSAGFSATLSSGLGPGAVRSFAFVCPPQGGWVKIYHGDYLTTQDFEEGCRIASVDIDWPVNPLSNTDTPASASRSYPNPSVPLSGSYSGGSTITIPAPARTVVNYFDLPERAWSDFTDQTASLTLTTSRSDLAVYVARVVLLLEYRPVANLPVIDLTATVTGRSGNPADVLDDLARRLGTRLEPLSGRRLRRWADAVGWAFARRIDAPEDAETLLHGAAREALCVASERNDGVAYIRRLDESAPCVTIPEDDLLERPSIEWTSSDDVASKLVLRHGAGVVVQSQDRYSRRAARQLGRERTVEMSSAWVSDAATAAHFAADWMRIYGLMRRRIGLSLPYKYADTQVGDVAVYEPLAVPCRVMAVNRDGAGFVSLEIEEIPQP